MAVRDTGVRQRVLRIDLDGALVHLASELEAPAGHLVEELATLEVEVVGLDVAGRHLLHRPPLLGAERDAQRLDDRLGDLVLNGEDVLHRAVVAVRPEAVAVGDVDQLGGDAELVAGFPNAALENRLHVQRLAHLLDVDRRALELERRRAGRDAQVLDAPEAVDQLLGDPLAEVVLVLLGAHVGERQHGDRVASLRRLLRRSGCDAGDRRALLLDVAQLVEKVTRRLIAVVGALLEAAADDPSQVVRQRDVDRGHRVGVVAQDRRDDVGRGVPLERTRPGEQLIEDDAEREDVRAVVGRAALHLLGRHVGHRADDQALLGDRLGRQLALVDLRFDGAQLGEAEVEHLHPPVVVDHHVGGLEVAVGDPLVVRRGERVGKRRRDGEELSQRHAPGRDPLGELLPAHQLHGQEVDAVRLLDRVDVDDVGVIERRQRPSLAPEPLEAFLTAREVGRQHLQRHLAAELRVLGEIDLAHAALAELGGDLVVGEAPADQVM